MLLDSRRCASRLGRRVANITSQWQPEIWCFPDREMQRSSESSEIYIDPLVCSLGFWELGEIRRMHLPSLHSAALSGEINGILDNSTRRRRMPLDRDDTADLRSILRVGRPDGRSYYDRSPTRSEERPDDGGGDHTLPPIRSPSLPRDGSRSPSSKDEKDSLVAALKEARFSSQMGDTDQEKQEGRDAVRQIEEKLAAIEEAELLGAATCSGLTSSSSTEAFQHWLAEVVEQQPDGSEGRQFFAHILDANRRAGTPPPSPRVKSREAMARRKLVRDGRRRWPGWPRPQWHVVSARDSNQGAPQVAPPLALPRE